MGADKFADPPAVAVVQTALPHGCKLLETFVPLPSAETLGADLSRGFIPAMNPGTPYLHAYPLRECNPPAVCRGDQPVHASAQPAAADLADASGLKFLGRNW